MLQAQTYTLFPALALRRYTEHMMWTRVKLLLGTLCKHTCQVKVYTLLAASYHRYSFRGAARERVSPTTP